MKRYLIFLIPIAIITGCQNNKTFTVKGVINKVTRKIIYLTRVDVDKPVIIDSSKISEKGKFSFKVRASEPDFYQLEYSDSDFVNLLAEPGEKISIEFKGDMLFGDYTVSGSKGSELVKILDFRLADTKRKLDSLRNIYKIASKEPGFEEKGPELESQFTNLIKEQRKKNIEFIINNISSMASIKALYQKIDDDTYVLYEPRDLQYLKIVADSLVHLYPGSRHVQALARDLSKEMNRLYTQQIQQMADTIPETKLDPDLKDINGNRIALSSLRGKYVLLTFWSASSKDCIADNLQLKEFYRRYNRYGFEIYQINLDQSEEDWKRAVRFDELPWINTREDDPQNPVNARLFNVKSVPANYLFDKNGQIIAFNLFGRSLQIKLDQLFNN
jgi:thiol-disulfide isomerase/thioredoxin